LSFFLFAHPKIVFERKLMEPSKLSYTFLKRRFLSKYKQTILRSYRKKNRIGKYPLCAFKPRKRKHKTDSELPAASAAGIQRLNSVYVLFDFLASNDACSSNSVTI
jgi:hypothetical protein